MRSKKLINRNAGQKLTMLVNKCKCDVKLKKKFHTAECILQGCSFSVNHNLSLLLITNIYILYIVQPHMQYIFLKNVHVHKKLAEVHNDTESVFSVTKCSFKPKPTRIRDGTILIFASTNPVQCTLALLKLKLQN